MINRYSSRVKRLDSSFLNERLQGARKYDRIAGYFSSSILEVAGEELESIVGDVRIVCNSQLDIHDVVSLTSAKNAMRREWCEFDPVKLADTSTLRFKRLHDFLKSGKLQVKVIPNEAFGLIHGKAGVITLADGTKTSFIGSINETYSGWKKNYEILWEDNSDDAVKWVEDEFEYFFTHPKAVELTEFIENDLERIINRKVIYEVEKWKEENDPASAVIESPVYRKELGLWEHQRYFVKLAFDAHKKEGARYVLADQVGLGKTIQLALSAQLMALMGSKPILIIAPKTLLWQWQQEMLNLLDMPSAIWTSKGWIDECEVLHPATGEQDIKKCPRCVGIISQGLISSGSEICDYLLGMEYECIIVDEAHRARRRNLGVNRENQTPDPNNLLRFLLEISPKTKSMLLATATPVQMYPVEAWDLLNVLAQKNEFVLGNNNSNWRRYVSRALGLVMGRESISDIGDGWEWLRNPFPPSDEGLDFNLIRRKLSIANTGHTIPGDVYYNKLDTPSKNKIDNIINDNFIQEHNPFIRFIVRRTREYLETTINPETNEPLLQPIRVDLNGDNEKDAIILPPYLKEAYDHAEKFCSLLKARVPAGGFLKTLLLKRLGSSIIAGQKTAEKMLVGWANDDIDDEEDDDSMLDEEKIEKRGRKSSNSNSSEIKQLTEAEKQELRLLIEKLKINKDQDPKYHMVREILFDLNWIERGSIIFTQYFDSARWLAENLSLEKPEIIVGVYAGGDKSGIFINGEFHRKPREDIKTMVKHREIKLLVGTDAAAEGLNLQTLSTLINLDLPWNPTKLEQRKGRIQRIGQVMDDVWIYNLRYKESVEDRVHTLLASRFKEIFDLFGQLPDVLEDVWIKVAENEIEEAKKIIDAVPAQHPFAIRNNDVEHVEWETCSTVLDAVEKRKVLMQGW